MSVMEKERDTALVIKSRVIDQSLGSIEGQDNIMKNFQALYVHEIFTGKHSKIRFISYNDGEVNFIDFNEATEQKPVKTLITAHVETFLPINNTNFIMKYNKSNVLCLLQLKEGSHK